MRTVTLLGCSFALVVSLDAQGNKPGQASAECRATASLSEKRKDPYSWSAGTVHFTGSFQVTLSSGVDGVRLLVDPVKPGRDWGGGVEVPGPIDRVALRSKTNPNAAVQPDTLATGDVTWDLGRVVAASRSGSDGVFETNVFKKSRATGTFSAVGIKSLPAGDLDIVVITAPREMGPSQTGERGCTIRARDRLRLVP